jgi:hypothetical protein
VGAEGHAAWTWCGRRYLSPAGRASVR